ncbi:sensor histidine kinase [Nannocystis bainbridge]|uniref:histidine kinase n=1 Tax=Nannocystis bainbridge TaxID=2995303 RepID=A0ABT5DT28_9BACT|nr:HAMP domain-containing sensor histidine kinase [Nannocystis bainbridge]MDC0716330.1 HAMP domain-containing sensor histidine kinase [Nannocystis bainbridge]
MSDGSLLTALLAQPHGLVVLHLVDGEIVAASPAVRALLGPCACGGARMEALVATASAPKLAAALAAATAAVFELQVVCDAGDARPLRFLVVPLQPREHLLVAAPLDPRYGVDLERRLLASHGELANLTRDLSRRAVEIEAARAGLEALGALRDDFMAAMAHDLRAPLTTIGLQAEMLTRGADRPSAAEVARRGGLIARNVARMDALMTRVLEAARLGGGVVALERRRVSLVDLAHDAMEAVQGAAERARLTLELRCRAADPWLVVDGVRVGQVLGNVLENSVRHAPPASTIIVAITEEPARLRCTVCDQGPGVPPGLRDQIFERFGRGEHAGMAGLGLYIARKIARLHGGDLWVEDVTPVGAAFVLELPRAPSDMPSGT